MTIADETAPVPAPAEQEPVLIPARMLNEFAYCPRLPWLEWAQGEWSDNVDTLEGKRVHRVVDQPAGSRAAFHDRSVHLSSAELGLTAVIDLIERDGGRARPIDYKRGRKPQVAGGAWEPEKVQLCAQGLLLREHGYESNEGVLYFAASRERVRVRFTPELITRTRILIEEMKQLRAGGAIPPPLEDSPKCPRCSLVGICLPEETNFLRRGGEVRPIAVSDPGTYPLVVQEPGSTVHLCGSRLRVLREGKEEASVPLVQVSQVTLMSGTSCSEPVTIECCRRGIPIVHMSGAGWLHGITRGSSHRNVELRIEQHGAARDEERSLPLARAVVAAKIENCRVLLRRNGDAEPHDLDLLRHFAGCAERAGSADDLLGIEGSAARVYFASFDRMLKRGDLGGLDGRSRRPPRNAVNALISFASSLLVRDWMIVLDTVGLDPWLGFYHRPKYGKPALALDMMEPFRPVIVDSVVIGAVNNGELGAADFFAAEGAVLLKPGGRRRFLEAYERRLRSEVQHPIFGYKATVRRLFEIEARLLGRHLLGEVSEYHPYRIR